MSFARERTLLLTYCCTEGGIVLAAAGGTAHDIFRHNAGIILVTEAAGDALCASLDLGPVRLSASRACLVCVASCVLGGAFGVAGGRRQGSHVACRVDGAGERSLDDEGGKNSAGRGDDVNANHLVAGHKTLTYETNDGGVACAVKFVAVNASPNV